MSRVLVWGGGGHGKVVADLVRSVGWSVTGYVDADPEKLGREVEPGGARVTLIQEEFEAEVRRSGRLPGEIDVVVLALGDNNARYRAFVLLEGVEFPAVAHPSAVISPSAVIAEGTVVFPRVVVNAAARVGRAAILNSGAIVEHDCVLADGVHVSPGAVVAGGARVGSRSWIGAGAVVLPGVVVGDGVVVGAGAVVLRDVPDGQTVAGVPARRVDTHQGRT